MIRALVVHTLTITHNPTTTTSNKLLRIHATSPHRSGTLTLYRNMAIQGIIKPPPDIRAVADKTALFVAKNGRAFETRILNSDKGKTPKFNFLHETSPFHAYYEDRIAFYESGGTDEATGTDTKTEEKAEDKSTQEPGRSADQITEPAMVGGAKVEKEETTIHNGKQTESTVEPSSISARKAKSTIDPVARALLSQRAKIAERGSGSQIDSEMQEGPVDDSAMNQQLREPLKFSFAEIPTPSSITPTQLDIIKLTAQFAALSGKGGTFLRDLTIREWNNYPVFGFLQPRHEHFVYFSSLVDLYRRVLAGCLLRYDHASTAVHEGLSVLERAVLSQMVGLDTWSSDDTIISTKEDVIREQDHIRYLSGSVTHCLDDVAYRMEYDRHMTEKKNQEMMDENNPGGRLLGGSSNIDWHDFVVVETIDFPISEVVEILPPPPPLALPTASTKSLKLRQLYQQHKSLVTGGMDDDVGSAMSEDDDNDADNDDEQIKIVSETEYTSKVVSATPSLTHVIDPITKRSIPIQDMSEHMRIQLLDPKWAEEKKKFLDKQKDSNFVQGDEIARNINSFAKAVMGSAPTMNSSTVDDTTIKNEQSTLLTSTGPLIPTVTYPYASIGNPLGLAVPLTYIPNSQAIFMQPPPSNMDMVTASVEPLTKKPRLDDSNALTDNFGVSGEVNTLLPKDDINKNTEGDEKEVNMRDVTENVNALSMSEADFARSLDDPNVSIQVSIPLDSSNKAWNFNGQTLSITVNVMTKVKAIKEKLQSQLGGMPINKMQLRNATIGFLKDATTLAYCNIGHSNPYLELVPKTRGGRK